MSEMSKINLSVLKDYKLEFSNEKDNYDSNAYTTFSNGYVSSCSDPIVKNMYNSLNKNYSRIKNGYQQIFLWWDLYIQNVEGMENVLSNDGRSGDISESLLRNYIAAQLDELPDYNADFTKLQFKGSKKFETSKNKSTISSSMLYSTIGISFASNPDCVWMNTGNRLENRNTINTFFNYVGAKISNKTESIWVDAEKIWDETKETTNKFFDETGKKISNFFNKENKIEKETEINSNSDNVVYNEDGSYTITEKDEKSEEKRIYYYDANNVLVKFSVVSGVSYNYDCIVKAGNPNVYDAYDKNGILQFSVDGTTKKYYREDGTIKEISEKTEQGNQTTYYNVDGSINKITDTEKTTYYNDDGTLKKVTYDYKNEIREIQYIYTKDGTKYEYVTLKDDTVKLIEYNKNGTTKETIGERTGGKRAADGETWIPIVKGTTTSYD